MNLIQLLEKKSVEIISKASKALERVPLKHYKEAGIEKSKQRLETLYDFTLQCVKSRNLVPIIEYSQKIARERYTSNFDLYEVQAAFNVLEEVIWQQILKALQPSDYAEALVIVSTVLGAGKDSLANTYVSLASKTKAPPIDPSALFKGTDGIANYP